MWKTCLGQKNGVSTENIQMRTTLLTVSPHLKCTKLHMKFCVEDICPVAKERPRTGRCFTTYLLMALSCDDFIISSQAETPGTAAGQTATRKHFLRHGLRNIQRYCINIIQSNSTKLRKTESCSWHKPSGIGVSSLAVSSTGFIWNVLFQEPWANQFDEQTQTSRPKLN